MPKSENQKMKLLYIIRILTEEISVQEMHETAAALRKEGCAIFFAAVRNLSSPESFHASAMASQYAAR